MFFKGLIGLDFKGLKAHRTNVHMQIWEYISLISQCGSSKLLFYFHSALTLTETDSVNKIWGSNQVQREYSIGGQVVGVAIIEMCHFRS